MKDCITENPFKFAGQWFDAEVEEYYLRARQYNPHLSRFTSRDPVRGELSEPITLHQYLYCGNDPVNWIDPSGEYLSGAIVAEPVMAGYEVHFMAIGYAAYGVASGNDAFLALGIQMEKMILPVMAIAMARVKTPSKGWNDVDYIIYDFNQGYNTNMSGGGGKGWGRIGKWAFVGTTLAIITYEYQDEIKGLFDPESWKEFLGIDDDDSSVIRAPDAR